MKRIHFSPLEAAEVVRFYGEVKAAGAIATAASPMVLAVLAQAYVFFALPHLPWVSLAWRTRGVPVVLSFAFWEWLSAGFISCALGFVICTTPRRRLVAKPPKSL